MSRADLERRVAVLRQELDSVTSALVHLDGEPTYVQLLAGSFTGATAERWKPTAPHAPEVWAWIGAARPPLDEAASRLESVGRVFTGSEEQAVAQLLDRRVGLDAPDGGAHTIVELIQGCGQVAAEGRSLVDQIDRAMEHTTPILFELEQSLGRARSQLPVGELDPDELTRAQAGVAQARALLQNDPLNPRLELSSVVSDVEAALDASSAIGDHHGATAGELAAAEQKLGTIARVRAAAEADGRAARELVAGTGSVMAVPPSSALQRQPDGLAPLLDRIRVAADRPGGWRGARVALQRWMRRADAMLAQLERAAATNAQVLTRHPELSGLLSAYEAKAKVLGRREDEQVSDLLRRARNCLDQRPVDLGDAEKLVAAAGAELE